MNSGESCAQLAAAGKLSEKYNILWQGIGPLTYFRRGKPIGLKKNKRFTSERIGPQTRFFLRCIRLNTTEKVEQVNVTYFDLRSRKGSTDSQKYTLQPDSEMSSTHGLIQFPEGKANRAE